MNYYEWIYVLNYDKCHSLAIIMVGVSSGQPWHVASSIFCHVFHQIVCVLPFMHGVTESWSVMQR